MILLNEIMKRECHVRRVVSTVFLKPWHIIVKRGKKTEVTDLLLSSLQTLEPGAYPGFSSLSPQEQTTPVQPRNPELEQRAKAMRGRMWVASAPTTTTSRLRYHWVAVSADVTALCLFCSGLFWTSWFKQRRTTSKTWASWWRWASILHSCILINSSACFTVDRKRNVKNVKSFPRDVLMLKWPLTFCEPCRASWRESRRRASPMTWKEKTKSSSGTSTRSTTGTESEFSIGVAWGDVACCRLYALTNNTPLADSVRFFVGELEKCLEDHEHLPELFIKHVSGRLCDDDDDDCDIFDPTTEKMCVYYRREDSTCMWFIVRISRNRSSS